MSRSIFAPVFIDHMWLSSISFDLEREPAESMMVKVDVDFEAGPLKRDEDGLWHEEMIVSVTGCLVSDRDESDVRLSASARIETAVGVNAGSKSEKDVKRYLTMNALSMSYSHARSCIMTVSGLSPMRDFILPPVLPDEVMRRVSEDPSD